MIYFIYILLLKIIFFFYEIINPAGALPEGFKIISKQVVPTIHEASGIADSKTHPGYMWVHEDSGNRNQLYLLGHNGQVARKVYLKSIKNRDWEDMALVENDLFLGDIGDNRRIRASYSFYRFPEPGPGVDTVQNIQRIRFKYPDGSHDAEAFLVDPQTQDIFILTKGDSVSLIYQLAAPYYLNKENEVKLVGKLPYNGVVSAALSPDGREILVKTYTNLFSYNRVPGERLTATLTRAYKNVAYQVEPQGEAITFAQDKTGFFTLSERSFGLKVNLYFYPYQH